MCSIPPAAADWASLSTSDVAAEVLRLLDAIEASRARVLAGIAVYDGRGGAEVEGFSDTAGWLVAARRWERRDALGMVARARVERDFEQIADAHGCAQISEAHVAVLADAANQLDAEAMNVSVPVLVDVARRASPRDVRAAVKHIAAVVADQQVQILDTADEDAFARRHLQVSRTLDGVVHVSGMLDPQTGAMFQAVLASLSVPRDESAAGVIDIRTADQRRVDALGEMCERLLAAGELPTSGGQRPHLTLIVDIASLQAHTGEGLGSHSHLAGFFDASLGPEAARRITCDASGTVVLTDQVGLPLAVGRTSRTVLAWQHKILRVRDNGCIFPGCNRPMQFSQAHHVRHWSDGGPTDIDNLVMLCQRHHRLIHSSGWRVEKIPDQKDTFRWCPPGGGTPIPAQHDRHRNPLTTYDWACEIAKIRAALNRTRM